MKIFKKVSIVLLVAVFTLGLAGLVRATLAPGAVDLGTADNFAIFADDAISDAAPTGIITGDVGLTPTTGAAITGLTCPQVIGTIYDVDGAYAGLCEVTDAGLLTLADTDLSTAYNFAAAQITTSTIPTDLAAATLTPGVYDSAAGTFDITGGGTLTLDGGGDPDAVFIFKMASTLNTSGSSNVALINGAQACNVFWQVGSSATFGTATNFVGTVMAAVSISDAGDSTILGRLLADADETDVPETGAVSLSNTTVTVPTCAPSLVLNKTVVNDNGGTALDTDWTLTATGAGGTPTNLSGTDPVNSNVEYPDASFKADTYTLAESGGPAGYTASTYSCVTNGGAPVVSNTIILGAGDDAVCTITNDDIAPQLIVNKIVVNDDGGTKVIADFPLFVDGVSVTSGVATTTTIGAHTVSETADAGYAATIGGDCAADGTVTLALGDIKTCTITNDDIAPVVPPSSSGGSSGGSYRAPVPPLIDVLKVPSPLALPDGPGVVEYTYTLSNIGTVPVHSVTMFGDTCSPITLISGDTNADFSLDVDETWVYTCSTTLTKTHTNIVTATGWANGISATDIASATVIVGVPVVPPLIHVTKVPSPLVLFAGGGAVTYRYTVTNPGTVPLSNVFVTDDKCTGLPGRVTGHPGDLNKNDLLESNEAWSFTCQSNLYQTTTNTGTASGDANGLTAKDFAIVTVVVTAAPKLPNTGLPPEGITVIVGLLTLIALFYYFARKKQTA